MARRILLSLLVVAVFLIAASTVFAAAGREESKAVLHGTASGNLNVVPSSDEALFSAPGMATGDGISGSLTITKDGSVAGRYALSASTNGSSLLAHRLRLVINRDADLEAGARIYDGSLGALRSLDLASFAAGVDAHMYFFHVSLPTTGSSDGDNALQGLAVAATFGWTAAQG